MNLRELRESVSQERRRLTITPDELRADSSEGNPSIIGHAAVFDRLSEDLGGFREKIKRGAFRKALDESHDVRLLVNHEGVPLARTKSNTLELREDPRGLRTYAELDPVNPKVQEAMSALDRRDMDEMSFGFSVAKGGDSFTEKDGVVTRTIHEIDRLYDVSLVTFPAYPQTDAGLRMERVGKNLASLDDESRTAIVQEIRSLNSEEAAASEETEELAVGMASSDAPPASEGMDDEQRLVVASLRRRVLEARIAAL